jgi:hypothetical protein
MVAVGGTSGFSRSDERDDAGMIDRVRLVATRPLP